jgi:hypothetical protein
MNNDRSPNFEIEALWFAKKVPPPHVINACEVTRFHFLPDLPSTLDTFAHSGTVSFSFLSL